MSTNEPSEPTECGCPLLNADGSAPSPSVVEEVARAFVDAQIKGWRPLYTVDLDGARAALAVMARRMGSAEAVELVVRPARRGYPTWSGMLHADIREGLQALAAHVFGPTPHEPMTVADAHDLCADGLKEARDEAVTRAEKAETAAILAAINEGYPVAINRSDLVVAVQSRVIEHRNRGEVLERDVVAFSKRANDAFAAQREAERQRDEALVERDAATKRAEEAKAALAQMTAGSVVITRDYDACQERCADLEEELARANDAYALVRPAPAAAARVDVACPVKPEWVEGWAKGEIETTGVVDDMHCRVDVATDSEIEAHAITLAWLVREVAAMREG